MTTYKTLAEAVADTEAQGPFAFPFKMGDGEDATVFFGMPLRDYFASHAPINFNDVVQSFGVYPDMTKADERVAFMEKWARLRYEYADAMLDGRWEET